jgi:hypothetical protein
MNPDAIINPVRTWVEQLVIGEALCPFARRPLEADRVRFTVTDADSESALLASLEKEIARLERDSEIETTLLIHPRVLTDFIAYNQFLDKVDALLRSLSMEGVFQVASFHPDYQFSGTAHDDAENFSNRSPYPLLHLIREESVDAAIDSFDNIDDVPRRNIIHLRAIGTAVLTKRLQACLKDRGDSLF